MKSGLNSVKTWEPIAAECRYSALRVAGRCGVSARSLRRFAQEAFGQSPHEWLHSLRLRLAVEKLSKGTPAKVTAIDLGYKYLSHFSRDFKKEFGVCPTECDAERLLAAIAENSYGSTHRTRMAAGELGVDMRAIDGRNGRAEGERLASQLCSSAGPDRMSAFCNKRPVSITDLV